MDYDRFILLTGAEGTPRLVRRSVVDEVKFKTPATSTVMLRGGYGIDDRPQPFVVQGNLGEVQALLNQHLEVFPTTTYTLELESEQGQGWGGSLEVSSK